MENTTMNIQARIDELMSERSELEGFHSGLVAGNQKMNQEFQQAVVKNQTRFAQITGAIIELQKLVPQPTQKDNNHDHSIPTPDFSDRTADVRPCEQSQGR